MPNDNNDNYEYEVKFSASDPKQVAELCTKEALSRVLLMGPVHNTEHSDLYLDAPDYLLLRHGLSLRQRRTSDGVLWTLKEVAPADLQKRREIETMVTSEEAVGIPTELLEALHTQLPAEFLVEFSPVIKLRPLAIVQQSRRKRMIHQIGTTAPLAELSIDEVRIYSGDAIAAEAKNHSNVADMIATHSLIASFCEVEAELLPGQGQEQLERIAKKLGKIRGLKPVSASKFERALIAGHSHLLVNGQHISDLQPTMAMADGCRLILRRQLIQMLRHEAGVRRNDDIGFVHDMRVAIRRARTAIRLFGGYFRGKALKKFRAMLRTTGRRLGAVRDLDVALFNLSANAAADTQDLVGDRERFIRSLQEQRQTAFAELIAWLDSDDYRTFVAEYAHFCASTGKGKRTMALEEGKAPLPYQVRHVAPLTLATCFAQVHAYEVIFEGAEPPPLATLHRLRIACKELRYLLEFCRDLIGPPAQQLISALKQLQARLGALNDAAVLQEQLSAFETPSSVAVNGDATQQATIARLRDEAASAFFSFIAPENRAIVAQAWTLNQEG